MRPGQCGSCGLPVLWVPRSDNPNRFNRPLDMATSSKRYVIVSDQLLFVDSYDVHYCRPDENALVAPPVGTTVNLSERKPEPKPEPVKADTRQPWQIERDEREKKERAKRKHGEKCYAASIAVDCPESECGAKVGEFCRDIRELPEIREMNPYWERSHVSRFIAGMEKAEIPFDMNKYLVKMADEQGRQIPNDIYHREQKARLKQALAEHNEKVIAKTKCPKCNASRGVQCWNLSDRRYGRKVHTAGPHPDRSKLYLSKHPHPTLEENQ